VGREVKNELPVLGSFIASFSGLDRRKWPNAVADDGAPCLLQSAHTDTQSHSTTTAVVSSRHGSRKRARPAANAGTQHFKSTRLYFRSSKRLSYDTRWQSDYSILGEPSVSKVLA